MKLFDSELKVMNLLWENGDMIAKDIVKVLKDEIGWNINTTYTVINKCVKKGAIIRVDPKFVCKPAIAREDIQRYEANELINKMFDGSKDSLIACIVDQKTLSAGDIERLKALLELWK